MIAMELMSCIAIISYNCIIWNLGSFPGQSILLMCILRGRIIVILSCNIFIYAHVIMIMVCGLHAGAAPL